MNKILLTSIIALSTILSFAQTNKKEHDNLSKQINPNVVYRLFSTQNMYNFIKLNTITGQMWQVQIDINSENRFTSVLSNDTLITKGKLVNDRFILQSTQNMYTFILLDQIDGKTWQVQWSIELEKRGIIPIE